MNEMTFNWDDLRLFLAVARGKGLAGAAKATGKSPPTLGRRMVSLEKALGAELFVRLPRGYNLTAEGLQLLEQAEALEARIAPLVPDRDTQRTLVKISAGAWMTQVLCAQASDIIGPNDAVTLRFIAADHRLDIARREAVIGIRNARPEGTGLAARRVGCVQFAGYGIDNAPRPWIRSLAPTPSAAWVAAQGQTAQFEVTTARNALDLVRAGAGQVVLPMFVGDAQPDLHRTTDPITQLEHDQWLVTHHEERFAPPVRKVIENVARILTRLHKP